jgi:diguanylate cyclase (GGDEF)-like protein
LTNNQCEKRKLKLVLIDIRSEEPLASALDVQAALASAPVPALLRIPASRAADVPPVLSGCDDVCQFEEPPALLVYRVRRLLRGADLDPLTQLLRRQAFDASLASALLTASPPLPLSLLHFDLDHFKQINERYLHPGGDSVLEQFARLLPTEGGALAGRLAGDEFVLMVPGLDDKSSVSYADRLCEIVSEHIFTYEDEEIRLTVSIGVSTSESPVKAQHMHHNGAAALAEAKLAGRNRAVHFRAFEREALHAGVDAEIKAFENMQRIVTERASAYIAQRGRQLLQALQNRADRDGLTGLFNRSYLDRRIAHTYDGARASSRLLCVALIDVDYFGSINKNKTGAWTTGDQALREIADLIRRNIRGDDWVAKYGGEEFAVVLPDISCEGAKQVIERVRAAVAQHAFHDIDAQSFSLTISAGVVELQPGEILSSLWQRLCEKLLAAKNAGRNQVVI